MSSKQFSQVKLAGVAAAVPNKVKLNQDILGIATDINKTAKIVGIEARHIAEADICTSDLCFAAADKLLSELNWQRDSVDALIFLSQTPDYVLPATSCVLQHKLGLSTNCAAFDMSLGCSGYIYGLLVAYSLIARQGIRRVLLLVGDTISKVLSPQDNAANILFGDAGTATAIEFDENANDSFITVGTDGSGFESLIIQAGGFRKPKSLATSIRKAHLKDNIIRSEEELFMDGSAVFGFTLSKVPSLVNDLLASANQLKEDIDYWLFHQANKFMLDHLASKIGISSKKMLMNINRFGNTSPPSIPLMMVSEDLQVLSKNQFLKLGLVGFGVGLSWGGALLQIKDLVVPSLIKLDEKEVAHVN